MEGDPLNIIPFFNNRPNDRVAQKRVFLNLGKADTLNDQNRTIQESRIRVEEKKRRDFYITEGLDAKKIFTDKAKIEIQLLNQVPKNSSLKEKLIYNANHEDMPKSNETKYIFYIGAILGAIAIIYLIK
jgi:hypothetical protein